MKRKVLSAFSVSLLVVAASFFLSCRVVDAPLPQLKMPEVLSVSHISNYSVLLSSAFLGTNIDIYYTLDASTPDKTKSLSLHSIFTNFFISPPTTTLKMRAYGANYEPSDVKTVDLTVTYP